MRRVQTGTRRRELVILLSALVLASAFPFMAQTATAQPGVWTDTFADETKVFSKSNAEVVGGNARIQVLASDYNWQKQGIVMNEGGAADPDGKFATEPWVLKGSDGLYRMWYSAVSLGDVYQIMYATSWDGYNWEKQGAVISPGFSGTGSDSWRVYSPSVIDEGSQYRLYYTAVDVGDTRITLMAVSPDGASWTYDGLALNVGGAGETRVAGYASVLEDGASYKSWYSGFSGGGNYQIFHATSPDAVTWTKQGLVMPNGPPGAPDDFSIIKNVVVKNSTGRYRMWYGAVSSVPGSVWSILYAESPDGVDWTDRRGIVLSEGATGDPDEWRVTVGSVRFPVNMAGWMWHGGYDTAPKARVFIATTGSLGNLTSTTITKSSGAYWETLFLNKTTVQNEAEVLVSVLNANTLRPYPGYSDLSGTVIDLSSIPKGDDNIRLRADFYGTTTDNPLLEDWTVTFVDPDAPVFDGLLLAIDDQTGGNVTLTWNAANDSSQPITYNVYMATLSMGQNFAVPDYSTTSVGLQVTGLTNGITYFFIVRAEDAVGNEDNNTQERGAMPTTPVDSAPPDFLGLVSATDAGSGGAVDLSWGSATDPDTVECNTDPSLPITFNIYYSTTSFGQNFLVPDATTQNMNAQISGLQNGVDHYFIVRASDAYGNEEQNIAERVARPTTAMDITPPDFFGLVAATDSGTGGSVDLSWASATDPDTNESSADPSVPITYNVYYSTTSGGQNFLSPDSSTLNTNIQIGGLQDGVDYFFVVRAEDAAFNEEQNLIEKSARPTTPLDITPPVFAGLSSAMDLATDGDVSLGWLVATDPDTIECNSDPSIPITYNIYMSTTSGGQDYLTPDLTTSGTQASLAGLQNGITYHFVVRAEDSAGNEDTNTIEMSAMPTTPDDTVPPDFAGLASAIDDMAGGSIALAWTAATDPDTVESNSDPSLPILYNIYVSQASGGQDFLTPDVTTIDTQITIGGLMDGVKYYFVVRAEDAAGNEEQNSAELSATPTTPVDSTLPTFGGLVNVTDLGTDGDVSLSWASAADPDSAECNSDPSIPLTYNVYVATISGGQNFLIPDQTVLGTEAQVSGLQNGVHYYFVVRAQDAAGNEEQNTIEMSALPTTPLDTSPPTFGGLGVVVVDDDEGVITLTWNPATDPDDPESNSDPSNPITYSIYVSETPTFDFEGPANVTNNHQFTFENLERGVTYYFLVRAEDNAGNRETNTISKSAEIAVKEEPFDLFEYLWIILLIVIIVLIAAIAVLAKKKKAEPIKEPVMEEMDEEAVEETTEEE